MTEKPIRANHDEFGYGTHENILTDWWPESSFMRAVCHILTISLVHSVQSRKF